MGERHASHYTIPTGHSGMGISLIGYGIFNSHFSPIQTRTQFSYLYPINDVSIPQINSWSPLSQSVNAVAKLSSCNKHPLSNSISDNPDLRSSPMPNQKLNRNLMRSRKTYSKMETTIWTWWIIGLYRHYHHLDGLGSALHCYESIHLPILAALHGWLPKWKHSNLPSRQNINGI